MRNLWQDVKYAARMLLRSPGFAITAILALALGIGANTAIFTVVNKVLLEPLAYPELERLVELEVSGPGGSLNATSIPIFNVWREQTQAFEAVTAYDPGGPGINLTGGDRPEQLHGIRASAGYFRVFGVPMEIGRAFTEEEDRPGGPKLVVLSNGLWRSRFGADPQIVGKTIELGGDPYVVTGVLGAAFHPDVPTDVILPLEADPTSTDQSFYPVATARLKPGVTVAMAKAAMNVAAEEFRRKFPKSLGPKDGFTVVPLRDAEVGDAGTSLLVLLGAVGFVLLIACANVANLLLVRATIRRREIAIRAALGAGRRRIISQLLTESVLLSLAGGAVGLVLGYFGVRALLAMNPGNIPLIGEHGAGVTIDWRVLGFTLLISVVTGILFGLIPALGASRADLSVTLRESGSRSGSGLRQNKARSLLVVTEMALALILLVGAALLIRTFAALRNVNPGFSTHNVLTMNMSVTGSRFQKTAGVAQLVEDARRRVEAVPGVEAMATTCCLPLEGGLGLPFSIEGKPHTNGPNDGGAGYDIVSPEYFSVFRIPNHHREGSGAGIRGASKGDYRDCRRRQERRARLRSVSDHVHSRGASAGRSDRAEFADHADPICDSDESESLFAERRNPEAVARGERRITRGACRVYGPGGGGIHGAERFQHDAADNLRGSSAAAGGDWDLRTDGLFGAAEDTGNWNSAGARRKPGKRAKDGGEARNEPGIGGRGDRRSGGAGALAVYGFASVWREDVGSDSICDRGRRPERGGVGRCLPSGAAGFARGSGGRVEI
ncbi:MAG: ABC transporter permease [Candidatus Acidiferrales bacterium]